MPLEPDLLHAAESLLTSWWTGHEDHYSHVLDATEAHRSELGAFLTPSTQASSATSFLAWTPEQLMQRRLQLRVAFGVEGSVAASGAGLFASKLMRIMRRIQNEEAKKEAEEEEGSDEEDEVQAHDDHEVVRLHAPGSGPSLGQWPKLQSGFQPAVLWRAAALGGQQDRGGAFRIFGPA
ncbi:unnamed protein product, partial [Effrenium voratum]